MEEQKNKLKSLRVKVESFRTYSDEIAKEYIKVLKEISTYLNDFDCDDDKKKLDSRLKDACVKLKVELRDRFDNHYFTMRDKKKADEFRYSRHIVSDSLKQIIKSL